MLKRKITLLSFLFLITGAVFANTKPFPGYYIDLKGDSVQCNIDFNDWNLNPKTVRVQVNNSWKEFGAEEVKGFGITGYDNYVSAIVSYHTNPLSGENLPENFSDSIVTKASFLKVLISGYYTLYNLNLPVRSYYFIGYHAGTVAELVYRIKEKDDSLMADESYKKELLRLFTQEGIEAEYFDRINNAGYNAGNISSLVKVLDEQHFGYKQNKKSGGVFQTEVFAGVIQNSFPTSFSGAYPVMNQFESKYSLSGGVNLLFTIPGKFKSFKIGLSFGYNGYNETIQQSGTNTTNVSANYYYTTTYHDTMTLKNSYIQSNFYIMYVINPLSRINLYVKAGVNYNFSTTSDRDVISHYAINTTGIKNGNVPFENNDAGVKTIINMKGNFFSYLVSLGVREGRSKLEFTYWPDAQLAAPSGELNGGPVNDFKLGRMAFNYYFLLF